jgi:hypothetical protein
MRTGCRWQPVASSKWQMPALVTLSAMFVKFIQLSETSCAPVRLTPSPEVFWIVPPEPADPVPATVKPPLPVVLSTMPLVPPLAPMLWNVRSAAPMVVPLTLSAVPPVELIVLPVPWTVTVPPPVALKPAPAPLTMFRPPPVKSALVFIRLIASPLADVTSRSVTSRTPVLFVPASPSLAPLTLILRPRTAELLCTVTVPPTVGRDAPWLMLGSGGWVAPLGSDVSAEL